MTRKAHIGTIMLALVLGLCRSGVAQQEIMISQYMFNGLFLNPAYAGSHHFFSSTMLHRSQWVHLEGAPNTSMFAFDGPLMSGKMGVGLSVIHDRIGVTQETQIGGNYSYQMPLGNGGKLSLGLKAGLSIYSAQLTQLTYWDENDQVFQNDINNKAVGKFGFGAYWYTLRSFIGLSVPTLYAADGSIRNSISSQAKKHFAKHYYLNAGHVLKLNEQFDLKASTLLKYQPQAPFQADLNANLLYRKTIWLGMGYRFEDSYVVMVEYQVKPELRIGYSYDMTTSLTNDRSGGSHEILVGMDLGRKMVKVKTPRYF